MLESNFWRATRRTEALLFTGEMTSWVKRPLLRRCRGGACEPVNPHMETPEEIRRFPQEITAAGDESDFIHVLNITAKATSTLGCKLSVM
jgi:hypothetical protein